MSDRAEAIAEALAILARANVPVDVQELLVRGNAALSVAPGALDAVIQAALRASEARVQELEARLYEWKDRAALGEWTLVPVEATDEMLARAKPEPIHLYGKEGRGAEYESMMKAAVFVDRTAARQIYDDMLGARPPIPPDALDAMVEKGARAAFMRRNGGLSSCWAWDDGGLDDEHPGAREGYLADARACILAAIGD